MTERRNRAKTFERAQHSKAGTVDVIGLHPNWWHLIKLADDKGFLTFDTFSIQDGLPMSADKATEKIRFDRDQD